MGHALCSRPTQTSLASAVAGYSSCRWNHDMSPSLRPSGARSSHCHIVQSPSKPREYAEYVWNTSSPSRANALMPGCSPDQSRQATFSASRCHCGIDRHVEVIVETAAGRRDPAEVPSHTPLVCDELVERGARHRDERDIVVLEVRDAAGETVGDRRAARTTFVPVRIEHEVIDEHLRTPAEQIAQRRIAVFGREPVVLLNLHPGQVLPPSRKFVAAARQFLFSFEQLEARCEPFLSSAECVGCHHFVSFPWPCF